MFHSPTSFSSVMDKPYAWKKQNGIWKRDLGCMEAFYSSLASPEGQPVHWMIGSGLTVTHHGNEHVDIVAALRNAWRRTRRRYPSVTAKTDAINQCLAVDMDNEAAAEDSFLVHKGITAEQLFSDFKSQFSVTLHFLSDTNELVVQAMHALLDGRGILYLFHALFSAMSSETPMDRPPAHAEDSHIQPNLNKPLDEWLHLSHTPSRQNTEAAQAVFGRFSQEKPVRLPGVDFTRPPGKAVHQELSLDIQRTRRIIDACKAKGITVTTAWHTAIVLAVKTLQLEQEEVGTSYVQFTTIDLRRWFPEPFQKEKDSMASLQTALPFVVHCDEGGSFESISKGLRDEYKQPFSFANGDLGCLSPAMAMYRQMVASGQVPPSSSTPYLSSMGVVDRILDSHYGDWELSKYWVSSTIMTGDFQLYLWTWRDQMVFSACYNDAFYESTRADTVLEAIRDQLEIGLGLA